MTTLNEFHMVQWCGVDLFILLIICKLFCSSLLYTSFLFPVSFSLLSERFYFYTIGFNLGDYSPKD